MIWNAKNGRVPVGDTEMSYVSFGKGSKVFIIMPGLSDGLTTVEGKALLLAKPYTAYFDEYTIYMFSRKNDMPADYTIRDMAADQAQALKALGLNRVSAMGVSEGGMIAQYLAIDFPELVEKLVIAVSAPNANDLVRESIKTWIGYIKEGDHKKLMIDTAEKSYSETYLKTYRRFYPLLGKLGKPAYYKRFLINAGAILSFDAREELDKISCPTLIIGGDQDKIVGIEASQYLFEHIAGSELCVYYGLGHAAYEEAKDFNEKVFKFLR